MYTVTIFALLNLRVINSISGGSKGVGGGEGGGGGGGLFAEKLM